MLVNSGTVILLAHKENNYHFPLHLILVWADFSISVLTSLCFIRIIRQKIKWLNVTFCLNFFHLAFQNTDANSFHPSLQILRLSVAGVLFNIESGNGLN